MATAVALYGDGRVKALLMSGEHGRVDHDQVAAMAAAADGVAAPDTGHTSTSAYGMLREVLAVDKAVLDVARRRSPRFPGPPEPAFDHLDG